MGMLRMARTVQRTGLRVDTRIPPGASQPDGTPFLAALAQGLQVTDILLILNCRLFSLPGRQGRVVIMPLIYQRAFWWRRRRQLGRVR